MLALLAARPAFGHEGGPDVHGFPNPAEPGQGLQVTGFNLGTDLAVSVILERDGRRWLLGDAVCDGQGQLSAAFDLPADLSPGVYTLAVVGPGPMGDDAILASEAIPIGQESWLARVRPGILAAAGLGLIGLAGLIHGLQRLKKRKRDTGDPASRID